MPLRLCAAGEPISTRWTQAVKQEIKQSRIAVTRQVVVCLPSTETHARSAQSQTTSVFAMLPAFVASCDKQWTGAGLLLLRPQLHSNVKRCLQDAINSAPEDQRPRVLVSTSAVGEQPQKHMAFLPTRSLCLACHDMPARPQRARHESLHFACA